ncbi:hypothetical protein F5Y03DRAFT_365787 [Xylaria venustula]|nr:hypothetical protein F5Y03DRAFT_365787 [Xylaria venustula]
MNKLTNKCMDKRCSNCETVTSSPDAPKLNSRFVFSTSPKLTYNIRALQPDYRPTRELTLAPRMKEVYENFDGYPRKTRWADRGNPPFDDDEDDKVVMIEQRMECAEEESRKDWESRQAGIDEQTRLDLAAKKARDKKMMEAKHAAQRAAVAQNPPKKKKEKVASCFFSKCFSSFSPPFLMLTNTCP